MVVAALEACREAVEGVVQVALEDVDEAAVVVVVVASSSCQQRSSMPS